MQKEISQAVIGRLPRYLRYLSELRDAGVSRISSRELSGIMKVTASQIRQDLNQFGGFGQQGYGYNVERLTEEIEKILGLDRTHYLIIVGAGNLGLALANYIDFERKGFLFTGIFDVRPELFGRRIRGIPVMHTSALPDFVRQNAVDIAVLTVPKDAAVAVAGQLVAVGVRAIWNFAQVDLSLPPEVQVENVHLSDSLMRLSYMLDSAEKGDVGESGAGKGGNGRK